MNPRVPATLDNVIVMVGDMFVAGYYAVQEWVDERHGEYGMGVALEEGTFVKPS